VSNATLSGPSAPVFGDVVSYSCAAGYTVSGLVGGPSQFQLTCGEDGTFPRPSACIPVLCPAPPVVPLATVNVAFARFGSSVQYTCVSGYTLSGRPLTDASFSRMCLANGTFSASSSMCEIVSCDASQVDGRLVGNGRIQCSMTQAISWGSGRGVRLNNPCFVECDAGYSLGSVSITTCQASGNFTGGNLACVDVNECAVNNGGCSPLAQCINTIGSYECRCPNGYRRQNAGLGQSGCVDIDECAVNNGGCDVLDFGRCVNLPGSFYCVCTAGDDGSYVLQPMVVHAHETRAQPVQQ
jgi:hypothetical protein